MTAPDKNKTERMETFRVSTVVAAGPNRQIMARVRGHRILLDVRKDWGGDDAGPTPPECLAVALGGCVLNMARIIGQEKKMDLGDIRIMVEGDLDPTKAFGIDTETRAGFLGMSVVVDLGPKVSDQDCREFRRELADRCPLCDTIANQTPFELKVAMAGTAPEVPVEG